jgi:hypothetical protein
VKNYTGIVGLTLEDREDWLAGRIARFEAIVNVNRQAVGRKAWDIHAEFRTPPADWALVRQHAGELAGAVATVEHYQALLDDAREELAQVAARAAFEREG